MLHFAARFESEKYQEESAGPSECGAIRMLKRELTRSLDHGSLWRDRQAWQSKVIIYTWLTAAGKLLVCRQSSVINVSPPARKMNTKSQARLP
jgi:hypothetical protein